MPFSIVNILLVAAAAVGMTPDAGGTCAAALWAAFGDHRLRVASEGDRVYVYQAYPKPIAARAVALQSLHPIEGFSLTRMSWIKMSLPWMLHRAKFGRAPNQERILKIGIARAALERLLGEAIPSAFNPLTFGTRADWRAAMRATNVIYQWDPERDLRGERVVGESILQIGLRGAALATFAKSDIETIEDITALARALDPVATATRPPGRWPRESLFSVGTELAHRLQVPPAEP